MGYSAKNEIPGTRERCIWKNKQTGLHSADHKTKQILKISVLFMNRSTLEEMGGQIRRYPEAIQDSCLVALINLELV